MAKRTSKTTHVMSLLTKSDTLENMEPLTPREERIPSTVTNKNKKLKNAIQKQGPSSVEPAAPEPELALSRLLQEELTVTLEEELKAMPQEVKSPLDDLAASPITTTGNAVNAMVQEAFPAPEPEPVPVEAALATSTAEALTPAEEILEQEEIVAAMPAPPEHIEAQPFQHTAAALPSTSYETPHHPSDEDEYRCINVIEEIVQTMLVPVMDRFDLCTCHKCRADVLALTLNSLAPKYVGTYKGQLFVKLSAYEKQYSTDVISALTKACMSVKGSPRH